MLRLEYGLPGILAVSLASLAGCGRLNAPVNLVPRIDGEPWIVAHDPDLGEFTSPKQQPVDFAVWPAADKTWQLWSCIRSTKCGGNTRLFHRWEAQSLTEANWKPMGIAMQADAKYGETPGGLQAPYVVPFGKNYIMFYGDWAHICLAFSRDGKSFGRWMVADRTKPAIFGEGPKDHTRDPMALRIGDKWYCYYTAYPHQQGADYCRTSTDLKDWSESRMVSVGGRGGVGATSAECPFVVYRSGFYYLFRTERYGRDAKTHIYRSRDPLCFNIHCDTGYVCTLPVAAPEIITHEGQDYIAFLLPSLKGIQIAKLAWDVETETAGK